MIQVASIPRTPRVAASILLVASLAMVGGAAAQNARGAREHANAEAPRVPASRAAPQAHARGADQRALSEAVRRVERRTGGQVLSAERVPYDGRNVNRIKVVDSKGRVRVYMDDPWSTRPPRPQAPRQPRTRDDDD